MKGNAVASEQEYSRATVASRWIQAVNNWSELGHWENDLVFDSHKFPSTRSGHNSGAAESTPNRPAVGVVGAPSPFSRVPSPT